MAATSTTLVRFIETRDKRLSKHYPHAPKQLKERFDDLARTGVVIVGGRASCGNRVDPSWVVFTLWNEIVRKARKLGYDISETAIQHKNSWASKAGGFWEEREYRLVSPRN